MTETTLSEVDLKNIGANGKPPKSRLSSARETRELVDQLIESNRDRSAMNAQIKGMFDGNPPFSRGALVKRGEGWRPNVNPMEGKAALSAAAVPYYDLFAGSMYYCEPKTYYGDEDQRASWDQIITEEFDCLLRDYEDFNLGVNSLIHDFVAFGKGFLMWRDEKTWHFEHISHSRIKVRDRAKACLSKQDVLVILDEQSVTDIWKSIRNRTSAEAVGWNISATLKAIQDAAPDAIHSTDYEAVQQQINDHDLSNQYAQPVVRLAHVYVKEFSGKITHLIVNRDPPKSTPDGKPQEERFLFKKQERFEKLSKTLSSFFLETLDGSWNGAAGLGKDILSLIEIKTRLFNKTVENAFIRSSMILQPNSASAMQKNTLMLGGGITIIPPDYTVHPGQIFADMDGVMIADRAIDEKLSNNTGIYRQKAEKPTGNPRTAEEVRLAYAQQAILGNSAVNRFYDQLDRFFLELFTRAAAPQSGDDEAADAARAFQKRCRDRKVPMEALRKIKSVRALRTIGNGSVVMKQQAFGNLFAISGGFPEEGRARLSRDAIVAQTGSQEAAQRYHPIKAITDLPNDHEALAVLENAAMKQGSPALVTSTQNHVIHANTHFRATAQGIQSLAQGANQEEVLAFLEMEGPHIATHIQKLEQDPTRKEEVKMLRAQWKNLASFTDKLAGKVQGDRQAVEEQQAEAMAAAERIEAINNGVDPETQIEAAKTGADIRRKDEKHALSMRQKAQTMQQKGLAAAQSLAIKDATAAAEIRAKLNQPARP